MRQKLKSLLQQLHNVEPLKHPAFVVALVLVGFATTISFLFTGTFNTDYSIIFYGTIAATLITVASHYLNLTKPIVYITLYHLIASIFLIFVAPIGGPYVFVWILIIYITHYLYGKKGTALSLLWLAVTLEYALIIQTGSVDSSAILPLAIQLVMVWVSGVFFSNLIKRSHRERKLLKETIKKAAIEHQRLLSLVNSMGDSVIATDTEGNILIYNAATLDLLNTNAGLTGQALQSLLKIYDQKDNKIDILSEARKVQTPTQRTDLRFKFGKNDYMNLYISIAPIRVGYNKEAEGGYTFLMRDITKEKSLEEERDEFISVVSHELRTPVTIAEGNIGNALFMTKKGHKKQAIAAALNTAHEKVIFLASLVNDLSTLARAERNVLQLDIEPIDASEILTTMQKSYAMDAKLKNLKFEIEPIRKLPRILSSKLYIEEILQNFVTNAIKYTEEGGIYISVRPVNKNSLKFSVQDTGIGIATSDQKRLFEKFFRSEDYRTRATSGTGLGLYIASKLAKKIDAKISFESKLNKGTTASLTVSSLATGKTMSKKK